MGLHIYEKSGSVYYGIAYYGIAYYGIAYYGIAQIDGSRVNL